MDKVSVGVTEGGIVLAVNGEVEEDRNMSNDCALNYLRSCFYYVLFYLYTFSFTVVLLHCLIVLFWV